MTTRCPECGREYLVKPEVAGRAVRCKCGGRFTVPAEGREPDVYELALPGEDGAVGAGHAAALRPATRAAVAAVDGRCPSCNLPLRQGAVLCLNCGFDLARGEVIRPVIATDAGDADVADDADDVGPPSAIGADRWANVATRTRLQEDLQRDMERTHRRQERTLPLVFLGVGVLIMLLNAAVLAPQTPMSLGLSETMSRPAIIGWTLLISAIFFVLQLPCLFVGIVIVSKLFGSAFGTLTSVVWKLTALALLGGGFHTALGLGLDILLNGFGFVGWMFKAAASVTVFYLVAKQLFDDLEPNETAALWAAMIMLPVAILVGVYLLFFY